MGSAQSRMIRIDQTLFLAAETCRDTDNDFRLQNKRAGKGPRRCRSVTRSTKPPEAARRPNNRHRRPHNSLRAIHRSRVSCRLRILDAVTARIFLTANTKNRRFVHRANNPEAIKTCIDTSAAEKSKRPDEPATNARGPALLREPAPCKLGAICSGGSLA